MYSMGLRTQLLGSGILNFGPCAARESWPTPSGMLILCDLKLKRLFIIALVYPDTLSPLPLPDIEQVTSAKILGVILSHTLSPTHHISAFLTQCNQRLYLLYQLKYQNLSSQALDIIFQALILSKTTYALPSFAGHISSSDKNRIDNFFRKA